MNLHNFCPICGYNEGYHQKCLRRTSQILSVASETTKATRYYKSRVPLTWAYCNYRTTWHNLFFIGLFICLLCCFMYSSRSFNSLYIYRVYCIDLAVTSRRNRKEMYTKIWLSSIRSYPSLSCVFFKTKRNLFY